MISLAAVETWVSQLWPHNRHAVVSLPDPKKGEQLVLVTDFTEASRTALSDYAREQGIAAISVPATITVVDEVPLLGTGKLDYKGIQDMVVP
jgi:acyl-[acyl-carrier-protein]-phospholipid O-acyltransferase/long-chain-fatty-acid--[acyl-carrier-protein] ligase